jgi:hypothetical protein
MVNEKLNPFIDRGPVRNPKQFVGRRNQVNQIVDLLQKCGSVNLLGKSRIGKTSLLYFLKPLLEEKFKNGSFPNQFIVVYCDLAPITMSLETPDAAPIRFFRFFFRHIHQAVERKLKETPDFLAPETQAELDQLYCHVGEALSRADILELIDTYFGVLFNAPQSRELIVVVMLDEADKIIQYGVGNDLRPYASLYHVSYIVTTRKPINQLDPEEVNSQLYNICSIIRLGLLNPQEAQRMIEPAAEAPGPEDPALLSEPENPTLLFTPENLALILENGGGHPDFLKMCARIVLEAVQDDHPSVPEEITRKMFRSLEGTCLNLWKSLEPEEKQICAQIANNETLAPDSHPQVDLLKEYGILNRDGKIFSAIFQEYVKQTQLAAPEQAKSDPILLEPAWTPPDSALQILNNRLSLNSVEVELTPQEAHLFRYLNDHRGNFCARADLFKDIWKDQTYDETKNASTINIAVQRLRDKLQGQFGSRLLIESKRGKGYRLIISTH